jgi:ketol-acid reductoisomerase
MPLKIIRGPEQLPLAPLIGKTVAVIGFGNQGQAHSLNLRDSGVDVVIGCRANSRGAAKAREQGFEPRSIEDATRSGDLVVMALPDEAHQEAIEGSIGPHLKRGATIGFLHGFSMRFGLVSLPRDQGVVMIAPKGPGTTLRQRYVEGAGIPCLFAMHQDSPQADAQPIALAWANGIGCARAGVIFTTFADETETDLFGEQAVLCGGMTHLILAAFETLVSAGYPPELAYLECCHEVKQIADLVYAKGLAGMMDSISNTAEFGAHQAGPLIVDEGVRAKMRAVLDRITDGSFARDLQADHRRGFEWFGAQREKLKHHGIEPAGEVIRSLMPWLKE